MSQFLVPKCFKNILFEEGAVECENTSGGNTCSQNLHYSLRFWKTDIVVTKDLSKATYIR